MLSSGVAKKIIQSHWEIIFRDCVCSQLVVIFSCTVLDPSSLEIVKKNILIISFQWSYHSSDTSDKVWYIVFVCQFQSFLSNYMVSHCHILLVYVHKQFVNNFVYKLVLSFAQILLFSSELTWLILLDNNRLVLIQYVKVFRGTAGMLFLLEPFSRSRNNSFFFFLIVKTRFFCNLLVLSNPLLQKQTNL